MHSTDPSPLPADVLYEHAACGLLVTDAKTSIYLVMPVGRPTIKRALFGGVIAAVLWEITRHVLVWYFATLSQVSVVYGSLTMAIVILLSLEWLATLLLFGAQVISQYERFGHEPLEAPQPEIKTG